jgi:hypothetical protein
VKAYRPDGGQQYFTPEMDYCRRNYNCTVSGGWVCGRSPLSPRCKKPIRVAVKMAQSTMECGSYGCWSTHICDYSGNTGTIAHAIAASAIMDGLSVEEVTLAGG